MLGRRNSCRVLENGILLQEEFPEWHDIAAVSETGTYYVAEGHKWQQAFREPAQALARSGRFPPFEAGKIQVVTQEELLNLYGSIRLAPATASDGVIDQAQSKLQKVMMDAAAARASDLKIIQDGGLTKVRIKVAGREFTSALTWSAAEGSTAMATIFDARDEGTGDATAVAGRFQSFSVSPGSARLALPGEVVKLRGQRGFHEMDTGVGNHMVLRLFYSDEAQADTSTLDALGFDEETSLALAGARAKLSGGVIIAGATGDGKSTTLVRCLQTLYADHDQKISIVTIEDPVEYRIRGDGIIQIPVRSAGDGEARTAAFRQALMHFVRINPDVGAISEVRDADAAKEVLQFIDTGHQVWTTIHGSTANGILFRLIEMGLPPEELCKPGSIELLMKQSLAPLLCPLCAVPLSEAGQKASDSWRSRLEELEMELDKVRLRNGEGCDSCRPSAGDTVARQAWTGYTRQSAVAEIIVPDEGYFEQVRERDSFGSRAYWLTDRAAGGLGGMPLDAKLTRLVLNGFLDPHDAVRKGTDFSKIDHRLLRCANPGPGGMPRSRRLQLVQADGGVEAMVE